MKYKVTAPKKAPKAALEKLGGKVKTLDGLRSFVLSLHPQVRFQKQMQAADADALIAYLESNGYGVEKK